MERINGKDCIEEKIDILIELIIPYNSLFHLTFPEISHKSRYLEMIEEWKNDLNPRRNPWVIFQGDTFEEFLDIASTYVTANPNGINSTLFFFMEDEGIFGAIQLWHHIEHPRLSLEGEGHGHIEYGLRPSARGKWIASELPRLWLIEAKNPGIETIIISADEDNPASWKTIEKCGWEFVQMKVNDGKNQKIYTINVWK